VGYQITQARETLAQIGGPGGQINACGRMRWVLWMYKARLNQRHREFGHLFGGRYKSLLVATPIQMRRKARLRSDNGLRVFGMMPALRG